jgi:benzoate membrane transport protein
VPKGVAAGMMAGILFQFGTNAFKSAGSMPLLTFGMMAAYLLLKRFVPRYCMVLVLLVGIGLAVGMGRDLSGREAELATPIFIAPEWTWSDAQLCVPLVLVSLTGQFLPGMAILHGSGYSTPAGRSSPSPASPR